MKIVDLSSDFWSERGPYAVDAVVLHTTEGTDSRTWLTKTGSVSANALIRSENAEPVIYRLVPRERAAWHAGRIVGRPTTPLYEEHGAANPNLWTYGIEIEGLAAGPVDPILLSAIVSEVRFGMGGRSGPVIGHRELSPGDRTDPGVWMEPILEGLKEDDMFTDDDRTKLREVHEALYPDQDGQSIFTYLVGLFRDFIVGRVRLQRNIDVERGGAPGSFDPAKPPIDPRVIDPSATAPQ